MPDGWGFAFFMSYAFSSPMMYRRGRRSGILPHVLEMFNESRYKKNIRPI